MVLLCTCRQKAASPDKKDLETLDERQIGEGVGDLVGSQKRKHQADESCDHGVVSLDEKGFGCVLECVVGSCSSKKAPQGGSDESSHALGAGIYDACVGNMVVLCT
jgi:hypothetical protein